MQQIGATISEFPITLDVATQAKSKGLYTVAGAPNILLGGSHSGNLSAAEAIAEGAIDVLCSDYYPPAMLHSLFVLHERHGHDLAQMFKLVTLNPAKAVRMEGDIGSVAVGKKADLLVIEKIGEQFPVVTKVLVDGKLSGQTYYRE